MTHDDRSDAWYGSVINDPVTMRLLTDAYTGRHAVVDALWWRVHPELDGPTGAPSPGRGRAELQAAVFGPGGTGEHRERSARRLQQLDDDLAADEKALDAALHSALPAAVDPPRGLRLHATGGQPWSLGRRGAVVGALAAVSLAVVVGAMVVFNTMAGASGAGVASPALPQPSTTEVANTDVTKTDPNSTDVTKTDVTGTDAASAINPSAEAFTNNPDVGPDMSSGSASVIFARAQTATDLPDSTIRGDFVPGSFRLLATNDQLGVSSFAARSSKGQVCLVVVVESELRSTGTCSNAAIVAKRGLQVFFSVPVAPDRGASAPSASDLDYLAVWASTGPVSIGQVPK